MGSFPRRNSLSLTLLIFVLGLAGTLAHAAPPLEQIRALLSERDYWKPSPEALKALDEKNLQEGLKKIDPYARYVSPLPIQGSLLKNPPLMAGVEIFVYKSQLWVRPFPDSPASRAGVPEIGMLKAIGGSRVQASNLNGALSLLDSAKKKGLVTLTVSGSPGDTGRVYTVHPAKYRFPTVTWKKEDRFLVLGVNDFVAHDTAVTLSSIYQAFAAPDTQAILDLRGCSGGDLAECVDIAGMYVPAGLPLLKTYSRSGPGKSYQSPAGPKLPPPKLILIDGRTASSAEILAGILQYYRLARLVGEQSYGKFESQIFVPLSDGGELWLTNLVTQLPGGNTLVDKGLQPDIIYPDVSVSKVSDIARKARL